MPAGAVAFTPWAPGQRPPWLDPVLAAPLPFGVRGNRHHPKWTEAVRDAVIGALAGCGSIGHAARLAGVEPRTVSEWLARGRADQQAWEESVAAGQDPGEPTEWHRFARNVTLAGGWWSGRKLAELQAIGENPATPVQLRAAILQWLLSRIGDRLTERMEVEHSGSVGISVGEQAQEVDDLLDDLVQRLEQRGKPRAPVPEDEQDP